MNYNINYYTKYLKYKQKYINEQKKLHGGGPETLTVNVATWNLLADGLAFNEFLTNGGDDNLKWCSNDNCNEGRGMRIVNCIIKMFENGIDILGTQENDHPEWIFDKIGKKHNRIKMIKCLKGDATYDSTSTTIQRKRTITTPDFDKLKAKIPILTPQNDTLTVYYNSAKFTFVSVIQDDEHIFTQIVNAENPEWGPTWAACLKFQTKNFNIFHIICAHLDAGEDKKKSATRVDQITKILNHIHIQNLVNPIILMDSNSSEYYESSLEGLPNKDDVLVTLKSHGYKDILEKSNFNECYKMRHGQGAQKAKCGELMFDKIDKIIIKNDVDGVEFTKLKDGNLDGFTRYDTINKDNIQKYRESKRGELKKLVLQGEWPSDVKKCPDLTKIDPDLGISLIQLYPNFNAPSDHPPCYATITFTYKN